MRPRRTVTTLLLVLLAATRLPALSVSAGATLQLPPVSKSEIYGFGVGGRLAVGVEPLSVHWFTIEPEFTVLNYRPNIVGLDAAWMLLPGLALHAQTPLLLPGTVTSMLGGSVGYRHYFWLSNYANEAIRAFRPVLWAGGHVLFEVSRWVSIGPAVSYNLYFDGLVRGAVQFELRVGYGTTRSP